MTKENFFRDVHDVVRLVPHGRVTSYGAIAGYLGNRSRSRMVGWAMHQAGSDVPAHRVVNSQGILSGSQAFNGVPMEELLAQEGIKVKENRIVDFKTVFWDPQAELG